VYRFLATPRWVGLGLVMALVAATMVGLGFWQLHRYHERAAINARIDAAQTADPVPVSKVLPPPAPGGGGAPPATAAWSRVTITGVYDPSREILARGRTVDDKVGYEVLTPLRLVDGSAVVVDRGWIPPAERGASARPDVPPAPPGQVTVVGMVHLTESHGGTVEHHPDGRQVRRIGMAAIGADLPYPIYGAYVQLDTQAPPADARLVPVPPRYENSWQNAGYVVQWWLMALLTLTGFVILARREARTADGAARDLALSSGA